MSTPSFDEEQCGACGGPLEDDRSVVCHTCTRPSPERRAQINALLNTPCPEPECRHELGNHGHGHRGRTPVVVCCHDGCPCGWRAELGMRQWHVWEAEYGEEGSLLLWAWTEKGAQRQYRRATNTRGALSEGPLLFVAECDAECPCRRAESGSPEPDRTHADVEVSP